MRKLCVILLAALCLCQPLATVAASPGWEVVQTFASAPSELDKLEVSVRDGYIYVSTPAPVTVKVMSIVGQLISKKDLPAGVSRIKIAKRGIYILKAGDATLRVTI